MDRPLLRARLLLAVVCAALAGCDVAGDPADAGTDGGVVAPDGDVGPDGAPPPTDAGAPAEITDRDSDGVEDALDAFPDDPAEYVDTDGDGVGNYAQADEDGDGVPDLEDALPFDPSRAELPTVDVVESDRLAGEVHELEGAPFAVSSTHDGVSDRDLYRFTATEGAHLTVRLSSDAGASLEVLDRGDPPVPVSRLPGAVGAALAGDEVVSFRVPEDGVYDVRVESTGPSGRYTLVVVPDRDLDAIGDDRELALGMRPASPDPDADGVFDASEIAAAFDGDGDGWPSWLDPDADGDGFADAAEGDADADRDGAPDHVDADADGDGTDDALAAVAGRAPLDTDLDGAPDYRDVDDDGDGLPDVDDADPTTPLAEGDAFDAAARLLIESIEGDLPGAPGSPGVVIAGQPLTIRGEGFGAGPHVVIVTSAQGARVSAPATRVSDTELTAVLDRPMEGELFVASDRASNRVPVAVVDPRAPLIVPPDDPRLASTLPNDLTVVRGTTISHYTIEGLRFEPSPRPTDTTLSIRPVGWEPSGVLRVYAGDLASNPVPVQIVRDLGPLITVPAGAAFSASELVLSTDSGAPGTGGFFPSAPVPTDAPSVLAATHPDPGDGRPALVLAAIVPPATLTTPTLDATSTAITQAMLLNRGLDRVDGESLAPLLDSLREAPAITALGARIETGLASDATFLRDPGPAYAADLLAALEAVERAIVDGLSAGTLTPLAGRTAEVDPPEQFDVGLRQREGTGDLDVENDTAFLLSAEVRDLADRVLQPHIDGPFDTDVIGAQRGLLLLFDASTVSLRAPGYRNATVEIVTPGVQDPQPTGARARRAQLLVRLRTALDRVLLPAIADLVGYSRRLQSRAVRLGLIRILLQQLPDTVTEFRAAMERGDARAGLGILANAMLRDLDSGGPITTFLARLLAAGARDLVASISARIAAKAVPVLGQLAALLEGAAALSTAINVGKVLADLSDTPGQLTYDVSFGFEATSALPRTTERAHRRVVVRVDGAGLASDEAPTLVTFTDEGGGFDPLTIEAGWVSADGTELAAAIDSARMARAVGPIRVDVEVGDERGTVPQRISVENRVRIDRLDPPEGAGGASVRIRGGGFDPDYGNTLAFFTEAGTLGESARRYEATVVRATREVVQVVVPRLVDADVEWDVTVEVGPEGERIESNAAVFNFVAPDLRGIWDVTFDQISCPVFGPCECDREVLVMRYEMTEEPMFSDAHGLAYSVNGGRNGEPGTQVGRFFFTVYANPAAPRFGTVQLGSGASPVGAHVRREFYGRVSALGDVYRGSAETDGNCAGVVPPARITAVRR